MPLDDLINSVSPAPTPSSPAQSEPLESGSIFDIALHRLSQPGAAKPKLSQGEVNSLAESLVEGWLQYFAAADASIKWIDAEREHSLWLDDRTLLVGRIDAVGETEDGSQFWCEWKSSAPPPKYKQDEWRATWKMSIQALTYGVLADSVYPGLRRFTVRKAYKSSPAQFAFEWYRYEDAEIVWWRSELLKIADEIRHRRQAKDIPWSPNFDSCFRYGIKYTCPFFHPACSKLKWDGRPEGASGRIPHLAVERNFIEENAGTFGQPMKKGVVILDATRTETWANCHERYRREYEEGVRGESGEALLIGSEMHDLLRIYYQGLIKRQT